MHFFHPDGSYDIKSKKPLLWDLAFFVRGLAKRDGVKAYEDSPSDSQIDLSSILDSYVKKETSQLISICLCKSLRDSLKNSGDKHGVVCKTEPTFGIKVQTTLQISE